MAEKHSKIILATFLATILLLQTAYMLPVNAQVEPSSANSDPSTWYTTVAGNLDTDTYDLYPYEHDESLTIGFSRFGEMINSINSVRIGLEYRNQDPFAPAAGSSFPSDIPPSSWLQGWLINITYNHPTAGIRNVWATAQHADTVDLARNWLRVDDDYQDLYGATVSVNGITGSNNPSLTDDAEKLEDPADKGVLIDVNDPTSFGTTPFNGGRKTNGTATTGPIEVLYDGPRRFVGVTHTTVYDYVDGDAKGLVDIVFTIDFNKVTKEVNVLKDIKMVDQAKFTIAPIEITIPDLEYRDESGQYDIFEGVTEEIEGMIVSFSNRGEFDLKAADASDFKSFVHFYTYGANHTNDADNDRLPTVYDNRYTWLRTMPPQTSVQGTPLSSWGSEPAGPDNPTDDIIYGTYDVAQIISRTSSNGLGNTVAWAAFWPSLSDWDVDGGRTGYWWQSLEASNPHRIDVTDEPFRSPYIIGEWDFVLTDEAIFIDPDGNPDGDELEGDRMFRGVSQYGVVDRHDELVEGGDFPLMMCDDIGVEGNVMYGRGDDSDAVGSLDNILDPEVAYYLKMKFCPWDLTDAANKSTQRHLYQLDGRITVSSVDLGVDFTDFQGTDVNANDIIGDTTEEAEEWRAYSTFAERVLVDGELLERGVDYTIEEDSDDSALIVFTSPVRVDDELVIYYSVNSEGSYEWTAVGRDSNVVDSAAASMVTAGFNAINDVSTLWAALDMKDTEHQTPVFLMERFGNGDTRGDYHYDHAGDDHRSALKKYWSTTIPIASSNIISVGGPGANLVTEYFNEFMPAIYRGSFFGVADLLLVPSWDALGSGNEKPERLTGQAITDNTDSVKYNITDSTDPKIIPVEDQDYGWAVISTYKDINGTVGFNVWGATGNDSFWAAQVFQNGLNEEVLYKKSPITLYKIIAVDNDDNGPSSNDDLIEYDLITLGGDENSIAEWLMDEEEEGVTTIILWIDYTDEGSISRDGGYHPKITIVEELGIISEIPQHDP
ncbi:MAG: hypothetical protein QXK74_02690 [Candidatus Nitrosocaldaceae archaeon]